MPLVVLSPTKGMWKLWLSLGTCSLVCSLCNCDRGEGVSKAPTFSAGYAAEWEHIGAFSFDGSLESNESHPGRRKGAGIWTHPAEGSFWLFGGESEGKAGGYLRDLWVYNASRWTSVYSPTGEGGSDDDEGERPLSLQPEDAAFPLLCGNGDRLSLFKGRRFRGADGSASDSAFNEEGAVWVANVSRSWHKSGEECDGRGLNGSQVVKGRSCNEGNGRLMQWTSYICCEVCLPSEGERGKPSFDSCPQFLQDPMLFCGQESFMALQLSPPQSEPKGAAGKTSTSPAPPTTSPGDSKLSPSTHISSPKNGSNLELNPENKQKNKETNGSLGWWKFDLATTEWEQLPPVKTSPGAEGLLTGNCRTVAVTETNFLYILCPTGSHTLDRSVLLLDDEAVHPIGSIRLNNAFMEKELWELGSSFFQAVRIDEDVTILLLAYQRLLDIWIHEQSGSLLTPAENVWKGESLDIFQHTKSFYKLSLAVKRGNVTKKRSKLFFMVNPREEFHSFADPYPKSHFQITIVSDKDVFLPARDVKEDEEGEEEVSYEGDNKDHSARKAEISSTTPQPVIEEKAGKEREDAAHLMPSTDLSSSVTKRPRKLSKMGRERIPEKAKKAAIQVTKPTNNLDPAEDKGRKGETKKWTLFSKGNQSRSTTIRIDKEEKSGGESSLSESSIKLEQSIERVSDPKVSALQLQEKVGVTHSDSTSWRGGGEEEENAEEEEDAPNLRNNYVSRRNNKSLLTIHSQLTHSGEMNDLPPVMVSEGEEEEEHPPEASYYISYSSLGSLIFFSLSLSLFASFGLFLFIRKCVKCPITEENILIKEPPPVRYAVDPDELSDLHNMPLV